MKTRETLHKRSIPAIESITRFDWAGTPLQNIYFIENRLPDGPKNEGLEPVVLVPGGFDPYRGEYSEPLIKQLLDDIGVPAVYEAHYSHEGNDGRMDVGGIVRELETIMTEGTHRPVVSALCGGSVCLCAALHSMRNHGNPSTTAALLIGPYLNGRLSAFGKTVYYASLNLRTSPDARHAKYAGHGYTPANAHGCNDWFRESDYIASVDALDMKARAAESFPFPVTSLYFKLDLLNREGRARLRRSFNATEIKERIPGMHRDLTRIPEADTLIAGWVSESLAARSAKANQGAA